MLFREAKFSLTCGSIGKYNSRVHFPHLFDANPSIYTHPNIAIELASLTVPQHFLIVLFDLFHLWVVGRHACPHQAKGVRVAVEDVHANTRNIL
jgi:hypothetical protein